MKILLLSWGIPTKKKPQYGCFAMDQAIALKKAGHEVGILSINGLVGKEWKRPGFHHWKQNGVDCFELFGLPIGIVEVFISNTLGTLMTKWGAKKIFNRVVNIFGFPDIVHAHFLQMMIAGAGIKEKYPITLVGTEHWSKLGKREISPELKRYGNYAYPAVDKLICVSKKLAENVKHNFDKNSVVIHNLFNTDLLKPAINETNNEHFVISCVGSLIPRKGFDILIKAFAKSKMTKENVIINIYGRGEAKAELEALIKEKGLLNKVNLCGQKSKSELYEALRHSDLFVLSSRLENFSVAMIEATGNGLPAVATLCGGIEEYPVSGVIKIPVEDVDAMKNAIEIAYDRRNEVDRIAIQKETIEKFSPEAIIAQIEKVYEEALKEK